MGIAIIRTDWSGTTGGPGLTQLAINTFIPVAPAAAQDWVDAVRVFWDTIKTYLPNELTLTVLPQVDAYVTETGDLDSTVVAATPPLPVLGGGTGTYAGGSGIKVTWETNQIAFGKRVRGSTFIVPATSGAFTVNGQVSGTVQTAVNAAAAALIAAIDEPAVDLTVWSRPKTTPVVRAGFATDIVQGICSSKSAILRSRRD